jgi:hypothetical protein
MSEWDNLPTPYETLVENETKHTLLLVMSIGCLMENQVITPSEMFVIAKSNKYYDELLKQEIERVGLIETIRTMLQYEDLRSNKKREYLIQLIKDYAKRNGTKNL